MGSWRSIKGLVKLPRFSSCPPVVSQSRLPWAPVVSRGLLGPLLDYCWITVGTLLDHCCITVGTLLDHFRITVASLFEHNCTTFGSL
eukprot:7365478-Heterocapsa_arctica.AAC.1